MAGATNPGNIGHAWVKSLWIDKQAAPGMEDPLAYDPADYEFIAARVSDNPIYANDESYLKTLRALPSHLRRAFLDGDWEVFAGQYFDTSRQVLRAETIDWKPWWPRWISVDWGFEHPAATYWHAGLPRVPLTGAPRGAGTPACAVLPLAATGEHEKAEGRTDKSVCHGSNRNVPRIRDASHAAARTRARNSCAFAAIEWRAREN
jgi:hypothetical protein